MPDPRSQLLRAAVGFARCSRQQQLMSLPMQLQIGDRMTDSSGEKEVVGRPYTTA